jgi:hypothetical protein
MDILLARFGRSVIQCVQHAVTAYILSIHLQKKL